MGVAQDLEKAAEWFRKAADQDHARAQYLLGQSYLLGEGVMQDPVDALQWFLLAAGHDNADANAQAVKIKSKLDDTKISAVEFRVNRFREERALK